MEEDFVIARPIYLIAIDLQKLIDELKDYTPVEPPLPTTYSFDNTTVTFDSLTIKWNGDSGTVQPPSVTLSVGPVSSGAEGNPVAGVTLSVGAISPVAEGNTSVTLSVGTISSQPEGN